jgi:sucrose phosphorylase
LQIIITRGLKPFTKRTDIREGKILKNKIMLITYPDSFGSNLQELKMVIDTYFKREISGIHILPFYPSSGDRGFAPIDYRKVAAEFGDWEDIRALALDHELMFDFMINHLSKRSPEFLDFIENHDNSKYKDMFLRFREFWPGGEPTKQQVDLLNKRKPHAPGEEILFADGTTEKIWCTFDEEQMDLNLEKESTWHYIETVLRFLMEQGMSQLRLDAFAFAIKKLDTTCFFLEPEIWEMMERIQTILDEKNIPMLPEIHDHYSVQMKIAAHGYAIYDFVLPVLLLHTLYQKNAKRLKHWLTICPRNQQTTLDTHDGLGTVDVVDLLTEQELNDVIAQTEKYGANFKWDYSENSQGKKIVYQINCSYFSAVGENEDSYLLARAIQFFTPGIPQVYYMGLLAEPNDYELMERTNYDRNISRHNYSIKEIEKLMEKPVVKKLCRLMQFRNEYPVFDGEMAVLETTDSMLKIRWQAEVLSAELMVDLRENYFEIRYLDAHGHSHLLAL